MLKTRYWLPLLVATLLGGCTANTTAPPEDALTDDMAFAKDYRIGIGDTLGVNVYRSPDLSVIVTVRPDGKITVPIAGDVLVGGQTPEEVSKTIADALKAYIRDPIVTTTIAGMGSNEFLTRIRVTGAVTTPQSLPYRNGMTVLDVVLESGGVNEFANSSRTILYRSSGEKFRVRLDKILNAGDMATNFHLRPGDVITVPMRIF